MSTTPTPQLDFEDHETITVGTIRESNMLDAMNVTDFGNEIVDYVKNKPDMHLLLNFKSVDYMSSAALTELLRVNDAVRKNGGQVRLCGLSAEIRKIFEITNLEKLFFIHDDDTVEQALKRFQRSLAIAAEEEAWSSPDKG